MRRLLVTSLLSLFLLSGTGFAYADHHRGDRHDKGRKEQRFDKKRPGDKKDKWHHKNFGERRPDRPHGNARHINHRHPKPPMHPGHSAFRPRHYNHAYHYPSYTVHDNLGYMVSRITRGGRDVNVWQVDPYTYVVRFRKGNHLYVQYLYPYEGRYGRCNVISINWAPLSPWALIPSIHLNINL